MTDEPMKRDWLIIARPLMVNEIVQRVAHQHDLKIADLRGPRRDRRYVAPRQLAMWLAVNLVPMASMPVIGKALNRDHTTVLYAVRKLDGWRAKGRLKAPEEVWREILSAEKEVA